ncbi:MAG TPA: ABC transporter permease [Kineosporiaceae bacterium]|nr:ABC transporter permease [Kineosporiaceae bacterium]
MTSLAGTVALTRLALRLDRVRLPLWVVVIGILPAATAANYRKLYPTAADLAAITGVVDSPSLVAMGGPLFRVSLGGLTAWKVGATTFILAGLMSVLTLIRHTRTEEESGRLELVGSTVVGRHAALTAGLLTVALADAGTMLVTVLGLLKAGMPAPGSLALGLAIGLSGMAFAAIAAVCAQLTTAARTATGITSATLGGAYLLRALGDTGPTWLSWVSPIGWAIRIRAYAGEQWWVAGLFAGLVAALLTAAYVLRARRDVGAGLIPERPAAPAAGPELAGPLGLAWRQHRGSLLGWVIGVALAAAAMGGAVRGISSATNISQQMLDVLARMGGRKALVDQFLAAVVGIAGLTVTAYTVQATLRLRAEESAGHVEPLLATRVSRIRWALSHLTFSVGGTALLLAVFGAVTGAVYGLQVHDPVGQALRITGASLAQLPAAWVLTGIGVALFGLSPRLATLTWAALITCVLLVEFGVFLGLSDWAVDLSPFAHVPKLPGADFTVTPLAWLTGVAALLGIAGLTRFRRRDIG